MTGQEFKDSLKNPKNIYCLVSTDSKIIDLYIKRFQAAINADKLSEKVYDNDVKFLSRI